MFMRFLWADIPLVALRKESVDRNTMDKTLMKQKRRSLSARRAWIEIVDVVAEQHNHQSRSPQGERG